MGFLHRIFGREPGGEGDRGLGRDLDRAESLLDSGRAYDALLRVQRAEAGAGRLDPSAATALRARARELEVRAREILIGSALAEADRAEADEEYDEAADWVSAALEHVARVDELTAAARGPEDDGRPAALRRRRKDLQRRGRDAARQPSLLRRFEEDERPGPDPLLTEGTFGALAGMLHEDVADLYLHRPLPFQKAYIDLNEGRAEAALAAFEGLVLAEPDDAVVRFERGRARMLSGDAAGAREDFEAVWDELGDDALDLEGSIAVPYLWADAVMELGEPALVAERLEPLADPRTGDQRAIVRRAAALREVGTREARSEALALLEEAEPYSDHTLIATQLAESYLEEGERERAIVGLEKVVLPVCSTGQCRDLDVYAARLLAGLYLDLHDEGAAVGGDRLLEATDRVLAAIATSMGGLSEPEDRELAERYHRAAGAAGFRVGEEPDPDGPDGYDPIEPS